MKCFALLLTLHIGSLAAADSPEDIIRDLKDRSPDVRKKAAVAAGRQKLEAALQPLADLLADNSPAVADAAANSLVRFGDLSVPVLIKTLGAKEPEARVLACQTLLRLGPKAKDAVKSLTEHLKGEKNPAVRIYAMYAIKNMAYFAKPALPTLFECGTDLRGRPADQSHGLIKKTVAETAIEVALAVDPACGPKLAEAVVPSLLEALGKGDRVLAQNAYQALMALGDHIQAALPVLEKAKTSGSNIAPSVLDQLITKASKKADGGFKEKVRDTSLPVQKRVEAIIANAFLKPWNDETSQLMAELLDDPEVEIRATVVQVAVQRSAKEVKPLGPKLVKLLDDDKLREAVLKRSRSDMHAVVLSHVGVDVVPGLVQILKDKKASKVCLSRVVDVFDHMGPEAKDAQAALETLFDEPTNLLGLNAAITYVKVGGDRSKALPVLRKALKHEDPKTAKGALVLISDHRTLSKDLLPELLSLLEHPDTSVASQAARLVSQVGPAEKTTITKIAGLLKTKDPQDFNTVCYALVEYGPNAREAIPELMEALKIRPEGGAGVSTVYYVLENIGPDAKVALPVLFERIKKLDYLPDSFIGTVGAIGPAAKEAVPLLISNLKTADDFSRIPTVKALALIGPDAKDALPLLRAIVRGRNPWSRTISIAAIGMISGDYEQALQLLLDVWYENNELRLIEDNNHIRVAEALDLLGKHARPALDELVECLLDPREFPGATVAARLALKNLNEDSEYVVQKLVAHLSRPENQVTFDRDPFNLLSAYGPRAKAAVPVLRQLSGSKNALIAEAASKTLERVTAEK